MIKTKTLKVFLVIFISLYCTIFTNQNIVLAAAGDFAVFSEITGNENIAQSPSITDITWDNTVIDATSTFTLQGNTFDIDLADAGHYLVMYSIPTYETTGGNSERTDSVAWLELAGTDLPIGFSQGYIRRNGSNFEGYNSGAAIIDASAGQDISVEMQRRDTNTDTTERRPNTSGVNLLKLDDSWDYLRLHTASNSSDISGNTSFTDVDWDTQDEVDTESFAHSTGTLPDEITLSGAAGAHFLVTYNISLDQTANSSNRQNYESILALDGNEVAGTAVTTYIRGNPNTDGTFSGVLSYSGIITKQAAIDEILTVKLRRESTQSATTVIVGGETAISIVKLPITADYIMLEENSGGQDLSTSRTSVTWDNTVEEDTTSFDHDNTNTERINIDQSDDYLFFSTIFADRTASTNGTRETQFLEWRLDGSTVVPYGNHGAFNRGAQSLGTEAYTSGSSGGLILDGLADTQYVELTQINEAVNADSVYLGGRMSLQGVNITSLFASASDSRQMHFRWRDDTTALNTSGGWHAVEDSNSIGFAMASVTYRLRMEVANIGGLVEASARTYELQWGVKPIAGVCADVSTWTGVGNSSDDVDMVASSNITPDGQATSTSLLANSEGYTYVNGEGRDTADTTGSIGPLLASRYSELEYSLQLTGSATPGDTYCFRVYDTTAGSELDAYNTYPELTIESPDTEQIHFRWRDDSTALNTNGGWLDVEDGQFIGDGDIGEAFRLRIAFANTGSAAQSSGKAYELQWGERDSGDTCANISTWAGIEDSGSDAFEMQLSSNMTEGQSVTPSLFTNSEGYTFVSGQAREVADTTSTITALDVDEYTELEYSFTPTVNATPGTTYCFRLYNTTNNTPLEVYTIYPVLTVSGGLKVQKILGSISGATSQFETIPQAISNVDSAFLLWDFTGGSSTDNTPQEGTCTGYISSTSQITIEKSSAAGTCQYAIYVVEALRNEFIVRGRGGISIAGASLSNVGTANNISNIVDSNSVMVLGMSRSNGDGANEWTETYTTLELTNNTTVTARRGTNTGSDTTAVSRFEVVEWMASGVQVETGEVFLDDLGTADQTQALSRSVDLTRSFVYTTFRHLNDGLVQTSVRSWLSSANQISFDRAATGAYDSYTRWFVVELPTGSSTQRNQASAGSSADVDITISEVEIGRSFPITRVSNSGTGNAFPRGRYYSNIETSTNLNLISGYSGNTNQYAYEVIDTSGWVATDYTFTQNDFEWFVEESTVNLTNIWPENPGAIDLTENQVFSQFPTSNSPLTLGDKVRIQMNLTIGGGTLSTSTENFKLQYAAATDCRNNVTWTDVGDIGSGAIWRLYNEASIGPSTIQTNQISTSSASAEGYFSEINPSTNNPNDVLVTENTEWDWPVENNGAPDDTSYCFRMALGDNTAFGSYISDSYPALTTATGIALAMRHGNVFLNDIEQSFTWAN